MTEHVYPKKPRERDPHLDRRWRLDCNLVYGGDGGGWFAEWSKGYRTHVGARLAAWWHYHIASWGGSVEITDTTSPSPTPNADESGARA